MSIKNITRPPSMLPSGFASFGSTASTISERDALTGLQAAFAKAGRFVSECDVFFFILVMRADRLLRGGPSALGARAQARYNTRFQLMAQAQKSRRETLEQFVADKPTDAFARYGLALECVKLGDDTAATDHFQKLLETHPEYVAGYYQFGQLLARLGRLDEARKLLSDGIIVAQKSGDMHARDEMQAALTLLR